MIRVIDNDPDMILMLRTAFDIRGIEVEFVGSQFEDLLDDEAWEGVTHAIVDVLLGDVITGVDVIEWLAQHQPQVCRIAFTAAPLSHPELREVADDIISKTSPTAIADVFRSLGFADRPEGGHRLA